MLPIPSPGRRTTDNRRSGNWSGSVPARVPRWFAYPPGEASARSALQGIISSAGWSGGASEFEAQWTRFKQHNAHVSWS